MKSKQNIEKFSLMLTICDDDMCEPLEEYLRLKKLNTGILFMGKGTAESDIADIFGFGMCDRCICATLVPESSQEKALKDVTDFLGIEKDKYGLAMLLRVSSASSALMDMLKLEY